MSTETFFCYGCNIGRPKRIETTRKGERSTCKICSALMIERAKQTGTKDTRHTTIVVANQGGFDPNKIGQVKIDDEIFPRARVATKKPNE